MVAWLVHAWNWRKLTLWPMDTKKKQLLKIFSSYLVGWWLVASHKQIISNRNTLANTGLSTKTMWISTLELSITVASSDVAVRDIIYSYNAWALPRRCSVEGPHSQFSIPLGRSTKVLGNIKVPPPLNLTFIEDLQYGLSLSPLLNFYILWRSSIMV